MATLDIKLKKANKVYREGVGYTRMPFSVSLVYKVLKRYRSWCILNRLVFPQEIYREVDKHHLNIILSIVEGCACPHLEREYLYRSPRIPLQYHTFIRNQNRINQYKVTVSALYIYLYVYKNFMNL